MPELEVRNKHNCLPPAGCTLPTGKGLPRVAVGSKGKGSYEAAFLVETDKLYETFANTVASISTLKAWFAYRLRAQAIKDGFLKQDTLLELQFKSPSWNEVWKLVQEKQGTWTEQYQRRGPEINPWELQSTISPLELFAHVLVVLAFHVTANTDTKKQISISQISTSPDCSTVSAYCRRQCNALVNKIYFHKEAPRFKREA